MLAAKALRDGDIAVESSSFMRYTRVIVSTTIFLRWQLGGNSSRESRAIHSESEFCTNQT